MGHVKIVALVLMVIAAGLVGHSTAQNPPASPAASPTDAGPVKSGLLVVGAPKIYDDLYLRNLLTSLQAQLASIHGVDQPTLLGHIGMVQGADTRQTSVALGASGPSTPQVSTFALAPGVPAFSYPPGYTAASTTNPLPTGVATATTPGTTTTVNPTTPSAPMPSPAALTSPALSSLGQSSLDTYNESLQLSAEITNTALLLNGAISDSMQRDGQPKATATIGFPITVEGPTTSDKALAGAVAEVHVTVCSNSEGEGPSIVTLLPQERSYNVASLVDKSFLGSATAVLGGVVNVGGGFLWSHQRYFLVQQQETVAFLDPAQQPACRESTDKRVAFAWQIRPVLGKEFIRPGNSVNFVQISIPKVISGSASTHIGEACVSVVWRQPKITGALWWRKASDEYLEPGTASAPQCYPIDYYVSLDTAKTVQVMDIGQGAVTTKVTGTFLPGTTVRLGNAYLPPESITATHDTLMFTAPATAIAAAGKVYIVGRDGHVVEAVEQVGEMKLTKLSMGPPVISPYSDDQSRVTITYTRGSIDMPGDNSSTSPNPAIDPWVVVIGGKVFGLSDAPFFSKDDKQIQLIVPTALLQSSPRIELRRLLWPDDGFPASQPIPADAFAKASPAVSKTSILSSAYGLILGLTGAGLDRLKLMFPTCPNCAVTAVGSTFAEVTLPKPSKKDSAGTPKNAGSPAGSNQDSEADPTDGLHQLVLCRNDGNGGCDARYSAVIIDVPKLDPPAAKLSLDKHDPIAPSAKPVTVNVSGTALDQVVLIEYEKLPLTFHLTADKKPSLALDIPVSIASAPGAYSLLVTLADKTTAAWQLVIQKPGS